MKPNNRIVTPLLALTVLALSLSVSLAASPKVGEAAPDFTLNTLDGKAVSLKGELAKQPVVVVVLRGWPGYQCPVCTRQVNNFAEKAADFSGKATVLMVYPGPAAKLKEHADEFLKDKNWPKDFILVTDPDYSFTKAYGLRWEAAGETAYPSTFIVDKPGKVRFVKISKDHGGRSNTGEVLKALAEIK